MDSILMYRNAHFTARLLDYRNETPFPSILVEREKMSGEAVQCTGTAVTHF
jgi:hypothetical protein